MGVNERIEKSRRGPTITDRIRLLGHTRPTAALPQAAGVEQPLLLPQIPATPCPRSHHTLSPVEQDKNVFAIFV